MALLACGARLSVWEQQHLDKLIRTKNILVVTIDQGFITQLVERLERSINWSITITEGTLYLQSGDETLETTPRRAAGKSP